MWPSSLGGGRILRRTLSVCLSICPSVPLSIPSVTSRHLANYNDTHVLFGTRWGHPYFSARTEGRISYGHLGRTDSCSRLHLDSTVDGIVPYIRKTATYSPLHWGQQAESAWTNVLATCFLQQVNEHRTYTKKCELPKCHANTNQCLQMFEISVQPSLNRTVANYVWVLFAKVSCHQNKMTLDGRQHLCRRTRNSPAGKSTVVTVCIRIPPTFCEPTR